LKEFDELVQKFHEMEKASSENFGEVSDDAKNSIKVAE
ncbi:pathogenicity island protein, partial [Staphylococcus aureus]|nr:pathogenicity island protein [Staphylococcus aureus]